MTVNGGQIEAEVPDRTLLVDFLRDVAGLTAAGRAPCFWTGSR